MPAAERREQLLDAALAVIERDGYGGVSMEAVAREAGVTRPVVYGAFDRLDPLLYALLDRQEQRALDQLMEALPEDMGSQGPEAFLVAAVGQLFETVKSDPATWRPILLAGDATPPAVRARIDRDRELLCERVRILLDMGMALRGGPAMDTEILAHALVGIAEHFGRIIIEDPERFDSQRLVSTAETLLATLRP